MELNLLKKFKEKTMDIAIMADIHGNFEAFQTCIEYARKRSIDTFVFLGDYLGEFAFPQRTMKYLYQLRDKYHCTFIRGNKEEYWLNYRSCGEQGWKEYDSTTGSLYYTYHNLTDKDMDFFEAMEIAKVIQFGDAEAITICHGSPRKVNEKLLPEKTNTYEVMEQSSTRLILCGHTHTQRKVEYQGKTVINPGSIGVPFWSCGKAQFLILHEKQKGWEEEFISLAYDIEKEIATLYEAKLDQFAPYWCKTTINFLRTGKISHAETLNKAMKLCEEEEGTCVWPNIPEKYWKKAYEAFFGKEDLQSYSCGHVPSQKAFPVQLESKELYKSNWLTLYSDKVRMPNGQVIDTYHRVHIPNESICVIITNEQGQILLIQSKRYTTGRIEWEIPAGRIERGECAESAVRRECAEETGCALKNIYYLCSQNPSNGITDILIHYYCAQVDKESGVFDENEVEGKRWVSRKEAILLLQNNGSRCGVSMFGLLYMLQFCS